MAENLTARDVLKFQIVRSLTNQSKNFLVMLEDLLDESPNFNYNRRRKVILDNLNNSLRELDELLSKMDVRLK